MSLILAVMILMCTACSSSKVEALQETETAENVSTEEVSMEAESGIEADSSAVEESETENAKHTEEVITEQEETPLEAEPISEATPEPTPFQVPEADKLLIDGYSELVSENNVQRMSLIYFDEDEVPELLTIKNSEYQLYTFDGEYVQQIELPTGEMKANVYGPKHVFEDIYADEEEYAFYWFEYVPYEGIIRTHGGSEGERHDYYLRYVNGTFVKELEGESADYQWYTYDAEKEIPNEEFLEQVSVLGYDKLNPCGYWYEDVMTAYENMGKESDVKQVLDDFLNGKIDAVYYTREISDIPEDGFVMKSYEELFEDMIDGDEEWGSYEYIDFDNDGKDEFIIKGYVGSRMFFDVIGDIVYVQLRTSGTTDVASVATFQGKDIIQRTDYTHVGRKTCQMMQYDACGCLLDNSYLMASYEGSEYTANDEFEFRNKTITMEEFEEIRSSIK